MNDLAHALDEFFVMGAEEEGHFLFLIELDQKIDDGVGGFGMGLRALVKVARLSESTLRCFSSSTMTGLTSRGV